MKPHLLVKAGLASAVLIIAGAVVLNLVPGQPASEQLAGSPAGPAPSLTSAHSFLPEPKASATLSTSPPAASFAAFASKPWEAVPVNTKAPPVNPKAAPVNPKAPAATPDPKRPLEVIPPAQQSKGPALPKSRINGPLIKPPLPAQASAVGKLVAGFPSSVIQAAPSSALKSTSVSPQKHILQVSLVAHSTSEPLAVMQFYQKQFAALGLGAAEAPASAGSSAMWFTRGADKITVTATLHQSGGTEYSVFGILHAKK